MRLSSDMFPFASHEIYGYKLAPFASDVLAEAGRVAAELGHRLTVHPGQVRLIQQRKFDLQFIYAELKYSSLPNWDPRGKELSRIRYSI